MTAVLCALWLSLRLACAAGALLPAFLLPLSLDVLAVPALVVGSLATVLCVVAVRRTADRLREEQALNQHQLDSREELTRTNAEERARLSSELHRASTHDPLTGLLNRAATTEHLDLMLGTGQPVGVLVVSLVGFAAINEAHGSDVGDELLAAVARRLSGSARASDRVGRLGGDEFAVLFHALDETSAVHVADRLPQVLAEAFTIGPHVLPLTARAGLARHAGGPVPPRGIELLRQAAQVAQAGRPGSGAKVFDPTQQVHAAEQLELEADMRAGLSRNEFFLLYQPLVCTRTGRMLSVEALVRWQHPTRGLIPPDSFIGLSERTGLIVPLGLRVLEMACAQMKEWAAVAPGLSVAVNVSARQLVEPDFVNQVRDILWRSTADPHNVILELTESLLVEDTDSAVAVLWQLRALGVRLALDDFGTGYSSLARLGELPLDEMKIDKSFVDRLGSQQDSTALVTAAVAMGHGLGLSVVAEGVETAEQAQILRSVECDLLQGYLLGKPQRPAELVPQFAVQLMSTNVASLPAPRPSRDEVLVPRVMPDR